MTVNQWKNMSGEEAVVLTLSKEEVRILHQSLNEVCNALTFSDSEFETRMGVERSEAVELMDVLGHVDDLYH